MRISRSALGAVAVAVSLAVSLSACSIRPGAAAVVDGRVISQDMLETAQHELEPLVPGVTASDILGVLIAVPLYVKAAEENGVAVSVDDAKTLLAGAATSKGLPPEHVYGAGAVDMARLSLVSDKLSKLDGAGTIVPDVQAAVGRQDVTVNPRYGTFDPASGQVTLSEPDWIAPAPTQ